MSKIYKYGLYLGRFQPLHIGHTNIIDEMLKTCETVFIAVGSAQESGTERNPLSFEFRKFLIYETYKKYLDRVVVLPIFDRETYSDDPTWGDYLLRKVYGWCRLTPDVIYEGEEDVRTDWYNNYNIPVIKVPRTIFQTSGSEIRNAILEGRDLYARIYIPIELYDYYDIIRKEIQNAKIN